MRVGVQAPEWDGRMSDPTAPPSFVTCGAASPAAMGRAVGDMGAREAAVGTVVGWMSTRPVRSRSTLGRRGVLTIAWCCLAVPGCARFGYDALPLDSSGDVVGPDASGPPDAGASSADCGSDTCPLATCSDGVQNQ